MKQAIILRKDLKLKVGKACSQSCHASVMASLTAFTRFKGLFAPWEAEGMRKIVLTVKNEAELLDIYNKVTAKSIPTYLVKDAGLTVFHGQPTITCCALGPAEDWQLEPFIKDLKLL
jgi:peptidyl-tRNA hydrolase, PTH2 family